jgi:hypothetical protein
LRDRLFSGVAMGECGTAASSVSTLRGTSIHIGRGERTGETKVVFAATDDHLGFEEYDVAAQIAVSHHYWTIEGRLRTFTSPHRYVWP